MNRGAVRNPQSVIRNPQSAIGRFKESSALGEFAIFLPQLAFLFSDCDSPADHSGAAFFGPIQPAVAKPLKCAPAMLRFAAREGRSFAADKSSGATKSRSTSMAVGRPRISSKS